MNFISFLLVGAGGAIGSMLRYGVALAPVNKFFPYHTFIVNIIGSFLIGALMGLLLKNNITNDGWKFLATGVCGGFTTFSAFSLEGFELLQQQRYSVFLLYFLLSIVIGLAATGFGYTLTK
ncbi:MAG: protein CrcB [Chitinophagaceae bacterium]|nr:protein CrcB [Chitinophagaceae bacterium]MDB5223085.1 protein CrcB [Chitinophagaceae bacterium]